MSNELPNIPHMNQDKVKLLLDQAADRTPYERCLCGCVNFEKALRIKLINGIVVGAPVNFILHQEVLVCKSCGELYQERKKEGEDGKKVSIDRDLLQSEG